jgi:hypothetical protein
MMNPCLEWEAKVKEPNIWEANENDETKNECLPNGVTVVGLGIVKNVGKLSIQFLVQGKCRVFIE